MPLLKMMFFALLLSVAGSLSGVAPASAHRVRDGLALGINRCANLKSVMFTVKTVPFGSRVSPSSAKTSSLAKLETLVHLRVLGSNSAIALVNFDPSSRCPLGSIVHGESPMKAQSSELGSEGGATMVQVSAFGS